MVKKTHKRPGTGLAGTCAICIAALMASGCAVNQAGSRKKEAVTRISPHEVITASYTEKRVVIDGHLDDPVWQKARAYPLFLGKDREDKFPLEGGKVMVAWDEDFLYIGAKLHDSDIYQEADEDQMPFFSTGDVLEVFLKPEKYDWYWELYGTPNNRKTVYWFPARKFLGLWRHMNEWTGHLMNLRVAARVEGTLNDRSDRDRYWTIEMRIPARQLAHWYMTSPVEDLYFGPGSEWRILIARYNYSEHLPDGRELSMTPRLSKTNFHILEEYGFLRFED